MTKEQSEKLAYMAAHGYRLTEAEMEAVRAALAELSSMQAAEKLMRTTNERLTARITELEAEVARLTAQLADEPTCDLEPQGG